MGNIWQVLTQTVSVAVMGGMLLGIRWFFRDLLCPKWRYALWIVWVIGAVVPNNGYSLLPFGDFSSQFRVGVELGLSSVYSSPWSAGVTGVGVPNSVTDWLFAVYGLWVVGSLIWFVGGYGRLCHRVQSAVPVSGVKLNALTEIANTYSLKLPQRTVESQSITSPFVMGVLRPTLVLPMDWAVDKGVVLHELLHLRYQDVLSGWVTTVLRCLYPLLWKGWDVIDHDRECACDQRVLERLEGEERRDYGHSLLSMVDEQAFRQAGATTMANGSGNMAKRIATVVQFRKFPRGMGLVCGCMVTILTATMVVGATPEQEYYQGDSVFGSKVYAINYGQENPTTTMAAAINAFMLGEYHRWMSPGQSLAYQMMCLPEENWLDAVADYEKEWSHDRWEEIERSYRTGPWIRNLSHYEDGYLVEVWMFRDTDSRLGEPEVGVLGKRYALYLEEQPDGHWTAKPLSITGRQFDGEYQMVDGQDYRDMDTLTTWTAETEDVAITVQDGTSLAVQGAFHNGLNQEFYAAYLMEDLPRTSNPDADANFSSRLSRYTYHITNKQGEPLSVWMDVTLVYPDGTRSTESTNKLLLEPNETYQWWMFTGGFQHINQITQEEVEPPVAMDVTVWVDEVAYEISMKQEVDLT